MRVLIALDASAGSEEIVRQVVSRPWPAGSQFFLLHVLDPFPFVKAPISLARAKAATASQLKATAGGLIKAGWKTETEVILGLPRKLLPQAAESWKADLIVVGSHDASALTRLLLGSTARAVLRNASCSVEVVRPCLQEKGASPASAIKILVATDGSEYSTAALRSVAGRPWPHDSQIKVMSIPEPFMPLGEFPYFELKEIEKLNTAALKDAQKYAEAGAKLVSKAGLETAVETPLPRDSDAREIVKAAERWQAGLVVLGSHGRRGFDRMTLGSVSEHVALHAPCSVEVIRGPLAGRNKSKKGAKR